MLSVQNGFLSERANNDMKNTMMTHASISGVVGRKSAGEDKQKKRI